MGIDIERSISKEAANYHAGTDDDTSRSSNKEELTFEWDSSVPKMGGGKVYPPMIKDPQRYMVDFDEDDHEFPQNFPLRKKVMLLLVTLLSCFSSLYSSSVLSVASTQLTKEFHVGSEVVTLCTSFFVFGYAAGPIVWGPVSEIYGRKKVIVPAFFIFTAFNFACATAKDLQTLLIGRFFAGLAAGAVMVVGPAIIADLFTHSVRGNIVCFFAMILFGAPMVSPIINGFIVKNHSLGWRWCQYISGIISALCLALMAFLFEETHPGTILSRKAHHLRQKTGNIFIYAENDKISFTFGGIITKVLTRPMHMFIVEPILLLMTIYNSFVFGLLYLFLTEIPLIFGPGGYNFSEGVSLLPYIGIILGVEVGGAMNVFFEKRYLKKVADAGKLLPEERLIPMFIGSICLPIGIFWLSWAGQYHDKVHWIVPTIGNFPLGVGLICIFLPSLNFLIECYLPCVASALAANTFMRYGFGGSFPLFARQMFKGIGIDWGGSLLAFFSIALIPMPILFYKYGKLLREKSRFALK